MLDQQSAAPAVIATGEPRSAAAMLPLVYEDLHRRATRLLMHERRGHMLQPEGLVHEAYLDLSASKNARWNDLEHFVRAATLAMRHVLVDHARDRTRLKRGGAATTVALSFDCPAAPQHETTKDVDDSLHKLGNLDAHLAEVVRLRYFGGFSVEQTAAILHVPAAQVKRDWAEARAFFRRDLSSERSPGQTPRKRA
ncbi:MAG: ECF-type sigma factor [Phycisphaerales bacterium]